MSGLTRKGTADDPVCVTHQNGPESPLTDQQLRAAAVPVSVTQLASISQPTVIRKDASISSINLSASDPARRDVLLYNDSTANARVKLGATASATSFSFLMTGGDTIALSEIGVTYTGIIDCIWESATGAMMVTELR